jgi:hypothetical protein
MRWAGNVVRVEEMMSIRFWSEILKRIDQLRRPGHKWQDNIVLDLLEIGWDSVDWIHLARDRDQWRAVVNTVMNLRVP